MNPVEILPFDIVQIIFDNVVPMSHGAALRRWQLVCKGWYILSKLLFWNATKPFSASKMHAVTRSYPNISTMTICDSVTLEMEDSLKKIIDTKTRLIDLRIIIDPKSGNTASLWKLLEISTNLQSLCLEKLFFSDINRLFPKFPIILTSLRQLTNFSSDLNFETQKFLYWTEILPLSIQKLAIGQPAFVRFSGSAYDMHELSFNGLSSLRRLHCQFKSFQMNTSKFIDCAKLHDLDLECYNLEKSSQLCHLTGLTRLRFIVQKLGDDLPVFSTMRNLNDVTFSVPFYCPTMESDLRMQNFLHNLALSPLQKLTTFYIDPNLHLFASTTTLTSLKYDSNNIVIDSFLSLLPLEKLRLSFDRHGNDIETLRHLSALTNLQHLQISQYCQKDDFENLQEQSNHEERLSHIISFLQTQIPKVIYEESF